MDTGEYLDKMSLLLKRQNQDKVAGRPGRFLTRPRGRMVSPAAVCYFKLYNAFT